VFPIVMLSSTQTLRTKPGTWRCIYLPSVNRISRKGNRFRLFASLSAGSQNTMFSFKGITIWLYQHIIIPHVLCVDTLDDQYVNYQLLFPISGVRSRFLDAVLWKSLHLNSEYFNCANINFVIKEIGHLAMHTALKR
jgi:hypothetical protein